VQPYNGARGPQFASAHPLMTLKEVADSDKHRVLAPSLGMVDFRGVKWDWDDTVARGETVRNFLGLRNRNRGMRDGTELAWIRFRVGNEQVKVRVKPEPTFDVVFNSDSWTLERDDIEHWILATRGALLRLATLFPRESVDFPPPFRGRRSMTRHG
jgi:hypothetical protein